MDTEHIIRRMHADRRLAHRVLFKHRHPAETAPFQDEMSELFHSEEKHVLVLAFRGSSKTTKAEEWLIIEALFSQFHNALVMGDSYDRAVERLSAIKREFETNEFILEIFGDMVGPVWQTARIELRNGVALQAFGSGQSMRGTKHLDHRPDRLLIDDLENEETVATKEARNKLQRWFNRALLPAMDPAYKARMCATPLGVEALPVQLSKPGAGWLTRSYPIEYRAADGSRQPTWPALFPLTLVDTIKARFAAAGDLQGFLQEYMVKAIDDSIRPFTADMFRVEPTIRTWQPVYAFYDPARTTNKSSDQTGKVVFSWQNNRCIVWEASGHYWKPDELLADIFDTDARYSPVRIGVEEDGLNEFILQPLRALQVARSIVLPIKAMKAPKGKIDFIKGLQPYFKAREIIFHDHFLSLQEQLLNFPSGLIDIANALAYAPRMRPGQPLYEHFNHACIAPSPAPSPAPRPHPRTPLHLAVNATAAYTGAALVQHLNGVTTVHADWLREGDPGTVLRDILVEASVVAGRAYTAVAPPAHFSGYDTLGLRGACAKAQVEIRRGGAEHTGREELRRLIQRQARGAPCLQVSTDATWVLRGFSGGYARPYDKQGQLSDFAEEGPYKVVLEGLESFASLLRVDTQEDDSADNFAYAPNGQRYRSALAR